MSTRRGLTLLTAVGAMVIAGIAALAPSTAAIADTPTNVSFLTESPVETTFGEDWHLTLAVTVDYDDWPGYPLGATDGTVDIYVSGIGGAYASGLPIQPDGHVYFSQPTTKPLLAAGEYEVTAIFNPAPGGYYATGQTAAPLLFTVKALDVTPVVEVTNDPAVSALPVITARLSGSYIDKVGGAPAGSWHFEVTAANNGDSAVFETEVVQAQGATDPVRVEVDADLDKGGSYTIASTFTPVEELAGGITVTEIETTEFQVPSGTLLEALATTIPLTPWLLIVLLALLVGLGAAAIVLGVRLSKQPATARGTDPGEPSHIPGDPRNVELGSLEDLGLPQPSIIPEELPPGEPTQKLPTSTTWLLSEVEPATSLPEPAEAPTERLEVPATELPTELLDTNDLTELPTERIVTGETAKAPDS